MTSHFKPSGHNHLQDIRPYLKNTILLSENAKVHNLAHEMAHYFQFYYHLKGDLKNLLIDPEPEAVRIQNLFRTDHRSVAARLSF